MHENLVTRPESRAEFKSEIKKKFKSPISPISDNFVGSEALIFSLYLGFYINS